MKWIILIPSLSILYAFLKMGLKYALDEEKLSFLAWCIHAFLYLLFAIPFMKGLDAYIAEWSK